MRRVVIDTDIIIDHLHAVEEAEKIIEKVRDRELMGYISAITELELLSGRECKNLEKRRKILELLRIFSKINVDNKIAEKAAEFRRNYGVGTMDCIIASTAYYQKSILLTRNVKEFKKIKEIKVKEPYRTR